MNRLENIGDTFYEKLCFQRPRRWNENRPYIKRVHRINELIKFIHNKIQWQAAVLDMLRASKSHDCFTNLKAKGKRHDYSHHYHIWTGSGVYPTPYQMCTWGFFKVVKVAGTSI